MAKMEKVKLSAHIVHVRRLDKRCPPGLGCVMSPQRTVGAKAKVNDGT